MGHIKQLCVVNFSLIYDNSTTSRLKCFKMSLLFSVLSVFINNFVGEICLCIRLPCPQHGENRILTKERILL